MVTTRWWRKLGFKGAGTVYGFNYLVKLKYNCIFLRIYPKYLHNNPVPLKVSSRSSLPSYQLPIYREPITALNVGFQSAANFRRRSQFWGELKFLQIRNYLHRRLKTLKTDWHKQSYLTSRKIYHCAKDFPIYRYYLHIEIYRYRKKKF